MRARRTSETALALSRIGRLAKVRAQQTSRTLRILFVEIMPSRVSSPIGITANALEQPPPADREDWLPAALNRPQPAGLTPTTINSGRPHPIGDTPSEGGAHTHSHFACYRMSRSAASLMQSPRALSKLATAARRKNPPAAGRVAAVSCDRALCCIDVRFSTGIKNQVTNVDGKRVSRSDCCSRGTSG